jgi:hypothetical protein
MKVLQIASAALIVLTLVGCGPSDEDLKREVTLEEAKNTLNEVVAATASADIQKLSDKFGSSVEMTKQHLEKAGGWGARPKEPPTVVNSYVIAAKRLNGRSIAFGGRVLVIEGTTGYGEPYHSEFFVSWDVTAKRLVVQYPIYWLQIKIGELNQDGTATTGQK